MNLNAFGGDYPSQFSQFIRFDPALVKDANNYANQLTSTGKLLQQTPYLPYISGRVDERLYDAYLMAAIDIGKLNIVGGVRMDSSQATVRQDINNSVTLSDGSKIGLVKLGVPTTFNMTNYLPRLALNYRFTDDLVLRGGYFMSIARPNPASMSIDRYVTYIQGSNGSQDIAWVNEGNSDFAMRSKHDLIVGCK